MRCRPSARAPPIPLADHILEDRPPGSPSVAPAAAALELDEAPCQASLPTTFHVGFRVLPRRDRAIFQAVRTASLSRRHTDASSPEINPFRLRASHLRPDRRLIVAHGSRRGKSGTIAKRIPSSWKSESAPCRTAYRVAENYASALGSVWCDLAK